MKKAIVSVVTGGYDQIPLGPYFEGWDSIMFTDQDTDGRGWEIRQLPKVDNPLVQSRDIKIRPHLHLPEYDLICYIDGNQKFLQEPPSEPIWYRHAKRTDIFQEAKQIIQNGRFPRSLIVDQINYYRSKGYKDTGLYLNGYHVRSTRNEKINKMHEIWFEETCRFSPRDQLSLPFAIFLTGTYPENIRPISNKEKYAIVTIGHKQDYYANN